MSNVFSPPTQPKVSAAAIVDSLQHPRYLLLGQRAYPEELAGQWEFPGGKCEAGETTVQALARELREELAVEIAHVGPPLKSDAADGYWRVTGGRTMSVHFVEITEPRAKITHHPDHRAVEWVEIEKIFQLPWIKANEPIARRLAQIVKNSLAS